MLERNAVYDMLISDAGLDADNAETLRGVYAVLDEIGRRGVNIVDIACRTETGQTAEGGMVQMRETLSRASLLAFGRNLDVVMDVRNRDFTTVLQRYAVHGLLHHRFHVSGADITRHFSHSGSRYTVYAAIRAHSDLVKYNHDYRTCLLTLGRAGLGIVGL